MKKNNLTREQAEEIYNTLRARVNTIISQQAKMANNQTCQSDDRVSPEDPASFENFSTKSYTAGNLLMLTLGFGMLLAGVIGLGYVYRNEVTATVQRASLALMQEQNSNYLTNENLEEVAIQLEAKRINLEQKERELQARAEELKFIDSAIQQKIQDLQSYLKRINNAKSEKSLEERTKLDMLVNLILSMPAKEAANLLQGLDNDVIVEILSAMPERRSGAILGFFNRERAVRIAKLMSDFSGPR